LNQPVERLVQVHDEEDGASNRHRAEEQRDDYSRVARCVEAKAGKYNGDLQNHCGQESGRNWKTPLLEHQQRVFPRSSAMLNASPFNER